MRQIRRCSESYKRYIKQSIIQMILCKRIIAINEEVCKERERVRGRDGEGKREEVIIIIDASVCNS